MSTFTARYRGICQACEDPIVPGQEISYTDAGDLVHVLCPESLDQLTGGSRPVCPRCFCVIPTSGVCGVCE